MRVRRGLASMVGLTVLVVAVSAQPASAADVVGAPCVREDLRMPAGSWQYASVTDAEPTGRFQIGWAADTSFQDHLIRWDDGVPADLGTPPGALVAVNRSGDIVGNSYTQVGETYFSSVWRYSDGHTTPLPGLPDSVDAFAAAIAPDGTVVGRVSAADGRSTAVTWSPANVVHALPGAAASRAEDVDTDGTVVGRTTIDNRAGAVPIRWAPGAGPESLPAYGPSGTFLDDVAVGGGTVIATQDDIDGPDSRIVVWAPGAAPVSYGPGMALAVNGQGSVVYKRVFENQLWLRGKDGVDHALPFDTSPFAVAYVADVTDAGIVYGARHSTPVRWICP